MKLGIVGCGLIARKRVRCLGDGHRVVAVADTVEERARALAEACPGAEPHTDWRAVVDRGDVDAVVVATTHNCLATVAHAAAQAGKHVLLEKPGARRAEELDPVLRAVERHGVCVQVGFNHRFHPALQKARELVESGELGPLMFVRGRYGHGGRPGYEREWRANPDISGGGELLDQGVHLIDLARWFLGDFVEVNGCVSRFFWDMPVEDNGFLLLETVRRQVAWLHASWTEWKNLFSFEIYGRNAKLHIEGLGGSYGLERLAFYKMLPGMGPPETTIWEYPGEDVSWRAELEAFARAVEGEDRGAATLHDARAALEVVGKIYREEER